MTNPLSPEQIELLRSLPRPYSELRESSVAGELHCKGWVSYFCGGSDEVVTRSAFADTLLATIDSERERVLAEVGAIAAEGVVSMNTTQQSIDKAIRRRDWGEVCGYIADLYEGRLALNAILAAANPSNPIKEGGEG